MDMTRRQIVMGASACALAAGAWYYSRKRSRHDNDPDREATVHVIECEGGWLPCSEEVLARIGYSRVIAIDCEWIEDEKGANKVALIQIAIKKDTIFMIRLCKVAPLFEDLHQILKDASIIKIGFDIMKKCEKLNKDYNIRINGCLDLRYMALATPSIKQRFIDHNADLTIENMVELILDSTIEIDKGIKDSDWEAEHLNDDQIAFASCYVSCVYDLALEIPRQSGWLIRGLSSLFPNSMWLDHFLTTDFNDFIGVPYRRTRRATQRGKKAQDKSREEKALKAYTPRSTPLYDNSVLLCPDGEVLCTCDQKKARWYLDNELGELVKESPLTVKLFFEPAQRAILDSHYYSLPKANICVVCGTPSDHLIRKFVVPREYRKHFPKIMKHHCAHDVVLTCLACHHRSCQEDDIFRSTLAVICEAPIDNSTAKFIDNPRRKTAQSAGKALLKNIREKRLPDERREELEAILKKFFAVEVLTRDKIREASQMDYRDLNLSYVSHGEKVVKKFAKDGKLIELEQRWRKFFLLSMKPRHLPEMWSEFHHQEVIILKFILIAQANPEEALRIANMLGINKDNMSDVYNRLSEKDKAVFEKMSIKKGRLMEDT